MASYGVSVAVTTDKQKYGPGDAVTVNAVIKNLQNVSYDTTANISITDINGNIVYSQSNDVPLAASGTGALSFKYQMPANVIAQTYTVQVRVVNPSANNTIGFGSAGFQVPLPQRVRR